MPLRRDGHIGTLSPQGGQGSLPWRQLLWPLESVSLMWLVRGRRIDGRICVLGDQLSQPLHVLSFTLERVRFVNKKGTELSAIHTGQEDSMSHPMHGYRSYSMPMDESRFALLCSVYYLFPAPNRITLGDNKDVGWDHE